jgi:hypothetical protein
MISQNQNQIPQKEHRKQGGAYDTLARVLQGIVRAVFRNGTVIEDRPGVGSRDQVVGSETFVTSPSVFEIYQPRRATDGYNLIKIGQKGTGEFSNTNYTQLNVDADTTQPLSSANGQLRFSISKDGIQQKTFLGLLNIKTALSESFDGPRVLCLSYEQDGANAGFEVDHFDANGNFKFGFIIDSDGIQMLGLPTSDPGVAGAIYRSNISTSSGSYSNVLRVSAG